MQKKKGDKYFPLLLPIHNYWYLHQQNQRDKYKNHLQKQYIYKA